jgi:hypothetical protein
MNGPLSITFLLATATHAVCLIVALLSGPANESFGVLFLAWLSVPSTVSAIGLAPRWPPVVTAAINGLITAVIVNTLLLGFSYFWPLQPRQTQFGIAVGYLLLFPAIAATCGAFVAIIIRAIENGQPTSAGVVGTRKGASFAAICGLLTLPVLILLLPPHSRTLVVASCYVLGALSLGTIVGALTGCSYHLLRRNPHRTQAA